ncbi:MAG: gliding motility-associated C-terminal domain-containing protein [Bacteroidota bacterium]
MKSIYLFFLLFLFSSQLFCQKEANIWYFGWGAGVDFNSGNPVALTDGQTYTDEGSATISDANGNLLFYTDGMSIWNKNHLVMSNGYGLLGSSTSTQSGVIVPKPNSTSIYYVFAVDFQASINGFTYSEVDMSLNGGLGDVNSNKNIQLLTPTCEKITAIKHANNKDIWVITHAWNSDAFYAYLITASGINLTPVISNTGTFINGANQNAIGYLKASPNGKKIAIAHYTFNEAQVLDFNSATGKLSNPITLGPFFLGNGPYGIEFSPSNQFIYMSVEGTSNIHQFDLNAANVAQSDVIVGSCSNNFVGALQLGPDGKIYITAYDYLSVIKNPDISGIGCNFTDNYLFLNGMYTIFGLPTFIQSYFNGSSFSFEKTCYSDSTAFNLSASSFDSIIWNFGDPNSGINNISKIENPKHQFSNAGVYNVSVIIYTNGNSDTTSQSVEIFKTTVNLGNDTALCEGETLKLDASFPNASYKWQDNSSNTEYVVNQPNIYWVEVSSNGCSDIDSINVDYNPIPSINLGNDTLICSNTDFFLNAYTENASYLWNNGSNNATLKVSNAGFFNVEISVDGCINSDSIFISLKTCDAIIEMPNVITPNGDGINDLFEPIKIENVASANMNIYNRWGNLLFQSNNLPIKWDGKTKNSESTEGTYFWIIEYTSLNGEKHNINGNLTLIN